MQPDSTWAGLVYPVVANWFPTIPKEMLLAILGTVISVLYAIYRWKFTDQAKAQTKAEMVEHQERPSPLHVGIPAIVGGVVAGVPGILVGAVGDGLRRAGWALASWVVRSVLPRK